MSAVLTCTYAPRGGAYEAQSVAVHDHIRRIRWSQAWPTDHEDKTTGQGVIGAHRFRPAATQSVGHAGHGLPLDVLVSAANRHDSLFVEPILDGMPE